MDGTNFTPTARFSTASPPGSTGQINVYFNKSVDPSLASPHVANGNQDLLARVETRIDQAQRTIDVVLYSLSGAPGIRALERAHRRQEPRPAGCG